MSQSNEIDPAFGHWLAGFIDGEGCFCIVERNGTKTKRWWFFALEFKLTVRDDDHAIMEEIVQRLGFGRLLPVAPSKTKNAKPQVMWKVERKQDLACLVQFLDEYPLRAKKRKDYELWKQAVALVLSRARHGGKHTAASVRINHELQALKREMEATRAYLAPGDPLPPPSPEPVREVPLFE